MPAIVWKIQPFYFRVVYPLFVRLKGIVKVIET